MKQASNVRSANTPSITRVPCLARVRGSQSQPALQKVGVSDTLAAFGGVSPSQGTVVQLGPIFKKAKSPPRITARRGLRFSQNDTSKPQMVVSAALDAPLKDFRKANLDRCAH
jgi:hypothetical protein